ncbi:response regulator transcription factor [Sphingomicrobium nitratireducens]|uniref:response regulator transcription factor n=1 Tax=Sphingomicrobium nitratireducens TaxID=2964666 RepID=UPI00223EFD4E|nr:helix-turn-helix transcriptional regulator [Sphingomicrobium nitratireducens]
MGYAMMKDDEGQEDVVALVSRLTSGQLECLLLVAEHLSSKEIAAELDISPHTVDQRVRGALATLGVARRQQAARLVAQVHGPYQRLIHQPPHVAAAPAPIQQEGAISNQIRHADRAGGTVTAGSQTEQDIALRRSLLPLPFATRSQPRNEMSVGYRLLWIVLIAIGATFSAGMYLAGLESLARLLGN